MATNAKQAIAAEVKRTFEANFDNSPKDRKSAEYALADIIKIYEDEGLIKLKQKLLSLSSKYLKNTKTTRAAIIAAVIRAVNSYSTGDVQFADVLEDSLGAVKNLKYSFETNTLDGREGDDDQQIDEEAVAKAALGGESSEDDEEDTEAAKK